MQNDNKTINDSSRNKTQKEKEQKKEICKNNINVNLLWKNDAKRVLSLTIQTRDNCFWIAKNVGGRRKGIRK